MAAYRRDDWPTGELTALRLHLEGCAECRLVEADFRGVGERIRRLPSITPPASMRAAVFAAIAAEEHRVAPVAREKPVIRLAPRLAPDVIELSRATTDPGMPVVRLTRRPPQRDPINLGLRAALIAAAVALVFLTARFLPGNAALSRIASGFTQGSETPTAPTHARRSLRSAETAYTVPTLFSGETPAMATDVWLVYASATGANVTLYAEDRQSQSRTALFTGDASQLLAIRALTDGWVLWTTGTETSGPWTLYAQRLPASPSSAPIILASSSGGLSSLTGVWARGETALLTGETASGAGELVRIDLANGTSAVLASATGHLYADPSAGAGVSYWSDVTFDTLRGLRGGIDQLPDGGQVSSVSADGHHFSPLAVGKTLAWIAVSDNRLMSAAAGFTTLSAESGEAMLFQLTGDVAVAGSDIGTGDTALAPYLAAGGDLLVWRTAGGWRCYDVSGNTSVDGLAGASDVALTDTAIVWSSGANATTLYVAPTR